jgi:hypothetical protein
MDACPVADGVFAAPLPDSGMAGATPEYQSEFWVPVTRHIVIFALLVAFWLPFLVLGFLQYISALSGLVAVGAQAFLSAWLGAWLSGIMYRRRGAVFPIAVGHDTSAIGIAVGALILCAGALVNVALEFSGCDSHNTDLSLAVFTFNQTCAELNVTITVGDPFLYRRPQFAFQYGWYQGCLDDMPVVITLMVIFAADIVLDALVIWHFWGARTRVPPSA